MTHAELVEKVARAIYEGANGNLRPWAHQHKRTRDIYLADATAALAAVHAALQEPSGEMIWAADPHAGPTVSFRVWQAMLDASPLKDGK